MAWCVVQSLFAFASNRSCMQWILVHCSYLTLHSVADVSYLLVDRPSSFTIPFPNFKMSGHRNVHLMIPAKKRKPRCTLYKTTLNIYSRSPTLSTRQRNQNQSPRSDAEEDEKRRRMRKSQKPFTLRYNDFTISRWRSLLECFASDRARRSPISKTKIFNSFFFIRISAESTEQQLKAARSKICLSDFVGFWFGWLMIIIVVVIVKCTNFEKKILV